MNSSALTPEYHCSVQYQIGGLAAQTITGTLKGQIRALQNATGYNGQVAIAARIVSSDGSTLRGELIAATSADNNVEPPEIRAGSVLYNRSYRDASESTVISLASVVCVANDVLIVEIGARDQSTSTSAVSTIEIGDPTAMCPWVEFSQTINFGVSIPTLSWLNDSYNHVMRFLRRPRMVPYA
jgi:hypothetical protein